MVVSNADIRPVYHNQKPRKIFKFAKANWEAIKADCDSISSEIIIQLNQGTDIEELWSTFKDEIHRSVERNVPSKTCRNKYSLPWVDRKLRKSLKKKARPYIQARAKNNWLKYRQFQKECKRQFRKAEWDHVNNIIHEGLQENISKLVWQYLK